MTKGALIMKNDKIITYTVDRNYNKKLYISVQNGEVLVNAPWYYTASKIQEIIKEKSKWILEKMQEYNAEQENKYIRNEIVKILGENCKVKINYKNLKKPILTVEGKNIKISLPNKYKRMNRDEILVKLIEKLYDLVAKQELELIMEKIRKTLGFAPEDYIIKRINNKIADCQTDKGLIIINPDIVKYDRKTIEYILIHEFCHLKYKTHSKKFNEIINENIKDFSKYLELCNNLIF